MSTSRKKVLVILATLALLGAVAAFGTWWFMFRKNPETVAQIQKINETQESVDEALGWDDAPPPAPTQAPAEGTSQ